MQDPEMERSLDRCAFESDHVCLKDLQNMFAIPYCDFISKDDNRACWTRSDDNSFFFASEVHSTPGLDIWELSSEDYSTINKNSVR